MQELIFIFNDADRESLGNVRSLEGLRAATGDGCTWLRGIFSTPEIDLKIKRLPATKIYYINEDNLLFVPGSLVPSRKLPLLDWQPLNRFLPVEMPVAAMPAHTGQQVVIKLVSTGITKTGEALLTTLPVWKAYAEEAPATRLAQLKFAVSENNEVLIMGTPLPPLPGKEYWLEKNLLLPNGYQLEIPLLANFINEKFNPQGDGVIIFDTNGSWQKIDHAFFVPAKRSAIRLTTGHK